MLKIQIKAITHWNGKETTEPRRSQFRQTYRNTTQILEKELSYLDIRTDSLFIEMYVHPNQVRADGQLRADARPYKQGVKLTFDLITWSEPIPSEPGRRRIKFQTVTYPCDAFDSWQDNLRAIALSLEALRKVERFGVLKFNEVVARLALPSAEGKTTTREDAAFFLANYSSYLQNHILTDKSIAKLAFREAAQKLHPDRKNENMTLWLLLEEAKKTLGV
jgi:hypothetical protein